MNEGENRNKKSTELLDIIKESISPNWYLDEPKIQSLVSLFEKYKFSHFQRQYLLLLFQSGVLFIMYKKGKVDSLQDFEESFKGKIGHMLTGGLDTEFKSLILQRATQIATNCWLQEYGTIFEKGKVRFTKFLQPESSVLNYYNPTEGEAQRVNEITEGRYFGKEEFINAVERALVEMAGNRPESLGFGLYNKLKNDLRNLYLIIDNGSGNPDRDVQEFAYLWKKMSEDRMLKTFGFSKSQIEEVLRILG